VRADACQAKRVPGTPFWRRAAHRPCTWLQSWHTIVAPVLSRRTRGAAIACMRGTGRKTERLGKESQRMYAGADPPAHHCTKPPPHDPSSSSPFTLSAAASPQAVPGPCVRDHRRTYNLRAVGLGTLDLVLAVVIVPVTAVRRAQGLVCAHCALSSTSTPSAAA